MKNCPHCKEKIGYTELLKHSFERGFTKEVECPKCNKDYKITMNKIFFVVAVLVCVILVSFVMKADNRLESKVYILGLSLLVLPIIPFFTKIKE